MKFKDLVYKITSSPNTTIKKDIDNNVNQAKKSVQLNDILIGVMVGNEIELTDGMLFSLKREIERTLTVLFNSPISDEFTFLPYEESTLKMMIELFPDRNFNYISTREEFKSIKALKQEKLNIKMIYPTLKKKEDFTNKIDYLVTINYKLESSMESALKTNNIMVFPMDFRGTQTFSQKEKLVQPDPSGWSYNSASGVWVKNWGNDGSQSIPGW